MKKVLILSAGTNASYHFAKTLKEKFKDDFYIIGVDINPVYLIPTAPYLDAFYQVPYSSDKSYYPTVLDICQKEKIDVLLPSFDADQALFYPENKDLTALGVFSLGTSEKTLPIYENKEKMTTFLRQNNLPTPVVFNEVEENQEYFVKPKKGVASIGAKKATGGEINRLSNKDDLIIQEVCFEPEITLECFYYQDRLESVARERIAAKSGVCVKTKVYQDKELHKIAQRFVSVVKTPLYFNLQFMKNAQNQPVITDVNLRLAGGMSLSFAAGWDEVSAVAKILLKKGDVFESLKLNASETFVVRAYQDIVTKEIK